jgi:hypothetical protein
MNPTVFEISVAIFMVTVSIAIVVWFQRYLAAASAKRMMRMMTRVGLKSGVATHDEPRTEPIMKEVRQRCRKCMYEDFCDRWIAGKVKGDNSFCPNARTFGILSRTVGRTG